MKKYRSRRILMIGTLVLFLTSCGSPSEPNRIPEKPKVADKTEHPKSVIDTLDVYQDIENKTMQELRLLRSFVYARHGMLFRESDLRNRWRENTAWYDTLSRSRYRKTGSEDIPMLSADEQALVGKIENRMILLQQANYVTTDGDTSANIMNVVNMFQYKEITQQQTIDDLAINNHAISVDTFPQLFQIYARNDSAAQPNFVTVDLLMQLSLVYESYMLQTVEQKYFVPMLTDLCRSTYHASMEQSAKATKKDIKDIADYNAAFFAVAYNLLTGKQLKIPQAYGTQTDEELTYIAQQEDHRPALSEAEADFPYSAFKPEGHYAHTAELRRYYKALTWLQLAPYCSADKAQLRRAAFAALMLRSAETGIDESYRRFTEAATWLYGRPAYTSLSDIAAFLNKERITTVAAATDDKTLTKLAAALKKPKLLDGFAVQHTSTCRNGIYFMPQPARIDNEALRAMTDRTKNAERAFPKALDIFAAFGSHTAADKLLIDNQEDTLWKAFPERLAEAKTEILQSEDRNGSLYDKRLECLSAMLQKSQPVPVFMQKRSWNEKNLTTASASWVKSKRDMLLYGTIPDYPEPMDTAVAREDIPEPITLGYVEPNLPFWKSLRERIIATEKVLKQYNLTTDSLNSRTKQMLRYATFMEDATRKELNNQRLPDEAYRFIAHIGDSIEQFTLSMIEPRIDRWSWAAGTDQSVAVSEEIYRRNVTGCPKNGALYAATGNANAVYVIVEIDGYLYLTKGAVFGYYEFPMPKGKYLSEKDWREMLRQLTIPLLRDDDDTPAGDSIVVMRL